MAIEDFTTYIEVDVNNKLTVTASKAEGADVDRDEDVYLYKDKGVDYFDALSIDFEVYIASSSQVGAQAGGIAVTNMIGGLNDLGTTDLNVFQYKSATNYRLYHRRGKGLVTNIYYCNPDTIYYLTLERAAGNDAVSLKIYSDSGRTNLLETLVAAGFGTIKWQYIYGFINYNPGGGGKNFDGYVQNLFLAPVQTISPTSIPSAEAFGALTVVPGAVSILPAAIASLEAFGTAKLNLGVALSGIVSGEAFGIPIVTSGLTIYPSAIPSAEALGNLVIAGPLIVPGIASAEAFGSLTVSPGGVSVAPSGISSEELFGLPKLNLLLTPSGIVTGEAFGAAQLNLKLILTAIASAEAFGTPTVKMILVIRPSGIASVELFGIPLLIVILAGGHGLSLPTAPGRASIPSGQVSIPSKEVSI